MRQKSYCSPKHDFAPRYSDCQYCCTASSLIFGVATHRVRIPFPRLSWASSTFYCAAACAPFVTVHWETQLSRVLHIYFIMESGCQVRVHLLIGMESEEASTQVCVYHLLLYSINCVAGYRPLRCFMHYESTPKLCTGRINWGLVKEI